MSTTITRKYIKRITKREGNTSIRQSGGGGGGGGGVSQYWVDDNYVSKEFFNRLFEIHDENGDPILPNDVETEIDNIQAMFGFWTNAYLSALGQNEGGGGVELTLASLADVSVQGVTDGQALVWSAAQGKWVPGQGGGIDITAMWAALAQSGVQQIDASHLGTALTGYATETWVGNQGYITGSALNGYATESWVGSQISDMATKTWVNTQISDMATQTWVSTNYLSKTDAASTYLTKTEANTTYLSISFFRALFRAYTSGGSEVVPNGGSTSTIDNIKAMFGFWTNSYLSALGNNPGGASLTLSSLSDVSISGATAGQVLTYRNGTWRNETPQGGGTDMQTVWQELAATGTQQINATHLTTALTGYATQSWVTQQGYLTASAISDMATETWVNTQISDMATETWVGNQGYITGSALNGYATESWVGSQISDMATQTWVGQNYLGLHATADAATKFATARTLWGQSFDGTGNVSGAITDATTITASSNVSVGGTLSVTGATTLSSTLSVSGNATLGGDILMNSGGRIHVKNEPSEASLYIGNSNDAGWVYMSDMCSRQGNGYWKILSNGNVSVGGTLSVTGATTLSSTLSVSGNATLGGDILMNSGGRIHVKNEPSGSSLYIGNSNDAGWVYMSDMCSRQGNGYWKILSNGNSEFANVYSRGYVTALSDIRHKDIQGDVGLTVSEVANAPAVKFLWKDRRQEGLQVGSIAQYWKKVLPEAIVEAADGELTMSYGVIALLASIANAREIVNLKREIAELKRKLQIN